MRARISGRGGLVVALALGLGGCEAARTKKPPASDPAKPRLDAPTSKEPTEARLVTQTYRAMGTQVRLSAFSDEPERARGAFGAVMAEFGRLEALHSNWRASSDISRLNARAGSQPVRVAVETLDLLDQAQRLHVLTRGKFDVCFGALSDLWRFDHDQDNRVPDDAAVRARLGLVDSGRLVLDRERKTAFLPVRGMSVHVGGIGKGFAVDRAVKILRARGFDDFMIQAGGDLYAAGLRGDRPWRVGIRDPRGPRHRFFAFAEVRDRTFSTSGDYERFFIKDGVRYHHILDPDTGRPARLARSVTILAPSASLADALSTGVFVLGAAEGLKIVDDLDGVGAVIVDHENRVHVSNYLRDKVQIVARPTP